MTRAQRERFIPFNVGQTQYYIDRVTDKQITQEEFESITTANFEKDKERGYQDRLAGYYDKWYRYNRLDEGLAYDAGQKKAVESKLPLPEVQFIPCINY